MAKEFKVHLEFTLAKDIIVVADTDNEALSKADKYADTLNLALMPIDSYSSYITSSNEVPIREHPNVIYAVQLDLVDAPNGIEEKKLFTFASLSSAKAKLASLVKIYAPLMEKNCTQYWTEEVNTDTKYGGYDNGYECQYHLYIGVESRVIED